MKAEVIPYIIARITVDIPEMSTDKCEVFDYAEYKYEFDERKWWRSTDFDGMVGLPEDIESHVDDLLADVTPQLVDLANGAIDSYKEFDGTIIFDTEGEVGQELTELSCEEYCGCPITLTASLAFKVHVLA